MMMVVVYADDIMIVTVYQMWIVICDAENEVAGCQDSTACNYNSSATDSGSCVFTDGVL